MKLGSTIKMLRKLRGMKQGELAKKVDITQTHLSLVESGVNFMTVDTICRVAGALGVTTSLIFFLSVTESDVPAGLYPAYEEFEASIGMDFLGLFFTDEELARAHLMEKEFDHNH